MEDFLVVHALKILTVGALMVVVIMLTLVRCERSHAECTCMVCDGECTCIEWAD